MVTISFRSSLIFVIGCITVAVTEAFVLVPSSVTNIYNVKLSMATGNGDSKKGYRFGDLTRGVLKKVPRYHSMSIPVIDGNVRLAVG